MKKSYYIKNNAFILNKNDKTIAMYNAKDGHIIVNQYYFNRYKKQMQKEFKSNFFVLV